MNTINSFLKQFFSFSYLKTLWLIFFTGTITVTQQAHATLIRESSSNSILIFVICLFVLINLVILIVIEALSIYNNQAWELFTEGASMNAMILWFISLPLLFVFVYSIIYLVIYLVNPNWAIQISPLSPLYLPDKIAIVAGFILGLYWLIVLCGGFSRIADPNWSPQFAEQKPEEFEDDPFPL